MAKKSTLDIEWLESRSIKMPSGCWHWTKHVSKVNGYGYCTVNSQVMPAHRAAYFIANGEWPNHTRHTCDNRICVNPDHLLTGTNADNVADKVERGRVPSGEDHPGSVLDRAFIDEVMSLHGSGVSARKIAPLFGVSRATIDRVINGTHWSVR